LSTGNQITVIVKTFEVLYIISAERTGNGISKLARNLNRHYNCKIARDKYFVVHITLVSNGAPWMSIKLYSLAWR
jgi:hypothetical protein